MGLWDKIEGFITDENYAGERSTLHPRVAATMEQALVLLRIGELTPKKYAKLADWDVDLLSAISRSRVVPGRVKESIALEEAGRAALALAVERSISRKKAAPSRVGPTPSMIKNEKIVKAFASWLESAPVDDNWRVEMDHGVYIQAGRRRRRVRVEVSGDRTIGGPACLRKSQLRRLSEMDWQKPKLGLDDYPNYYMEFPWDRDEGKGVPPRVVWSCTQVMARTLTYIFTE